MTDDIHEHLARERIDADRSELQKRVAELEAELKDAERRYVSACKGRQEFRRALKTERGSVAGYAVATRTVQGSVIISTPVFATEQEACDWADLHTDLGITGNPSGFIIELREAPKGGT